MQDINLTTTLKFSEITKQISKVINNPLKFVIFIIFNLFRLSFLSHKYLAFENLHGKKKKITAEKIKILQKNSKSR